MKTRVFCGPTISAAEVKARLPDASVEGPVALGDVLSALEQGFEQIAIVDGYFDHRQPVWHKEILWAIHRGADVYGAASMGALRAVELAPFGMRGVGRIFELFRAGWLERDDEVTIAHGPAEAGYRAHSDALINMRFSFRLAARHGIVPLAFAERCSEMAERTFYAERTYTNVLEAAGESPEDAEVAANLRRWLEPSRGHRVDQKHSDALALLDVLARTDDAAPQPLGRRPGFHFANTHGWNEFLKSRKRTQ